MGYSIGCGIALLACFCFWIIRVDWLSRVGITMAVCGVLFNLLAILANRGYMPYVPFGTDDTEREGTFGGAYGPFDRSTRLRLLADWIDLGWVGQVSPGDLLIAAGILAQLSGWAVY